MTIKKITPGGSNLSLYNIDTANIGFYNSDAFKRQEKNNPLFLNEYNYFVSTKNYSDDYLIISKKKIHIICDVLYSELKKIGRTGACIDISTVLMKILEKEGIWCCMMTGSVKESFSKETNIEDIYFYSLDDSREFKVAHAWIYAPPFEIIDLSISLQQYQGDEIKYLPIYVLEENSSTSSLDPSDIISGTMLQNYGIEKTQQIFNNFYYQHNRFISIYQPMIVYYSNVSIKYTPIHAFATTMNLEQISSIIFDNQKTAFQIYNEKIKPLLEKI